VWDVGLSEFSMNKVFLHEHFRCVPDIAGVFNSIFYHHRLVPMRPCTQELACKQVSVDIQERQNNENPSQMKNRVQPMLKEVASCVREDITTRFSEQRVMDIGIIPMGNADFVEFLSNDFKHYLEALLSDQYDPKIVADLRIRVGNPSQFQGDERSHIYIVMADIGRIQRGPDDEKVC
jgi:superfamily I DNA and/or RNA helicase